MTARAIIAAVSPEGVIGLDGKIPWHYPEDLKRFKRLTIGATIIMGRLTFESMGSRGPSWFTAPHSVFSDEPHLCLTRSAWHPEVRAATEQHFIVTLATGELVKYVGTSQAYSETAYAELLSDAGLLVVETYPSLSGVPAEGDQDLFVLVARANS